MSPTSIKRRLSPTAEQRQLLLKKGLMVNGSIFVDGSILFEAPIKIENSAIVDSKIGKYSYVGSSCRLHRAIVGRYCSFADNIIFGPFSHPMDRISTSPAIGTSEFDWFYQVQNHTVYEDNKSVEIGNDVWIGSGATIMGNVRVGDGAVVGTGAVVTKDVEPYTIVGGVPAKPIRLRFGLPIVSRLCMLKPWNYELREFFDKNPLLVSSLLDDNFLDILESAIESKELVRTTSTYTKLYPNREGTWNLDNT